MNRGTFEQFKNNIGEYQSANRYDAVDTSNRLGRFALGEHTLERIGLVNRDNTPTQNDYNGGWTGKYGITSTEEFLASPAAQDRAFDDVLDRDVNTLRHVIHYDGQTLGGQEISISGMLGAASLTNTFRVWSYVKFGSHNFPEVTGQPPVAESVARFNGYETPYSVNPNRDYTFWGREGADRIQGYNGNDAFFAKGGNDTFDGGTGVDTIILSLTPDDYVIGRGSGPSEWHIRRQLGDGSAERKDIRNVEVIAFDNGEILDLCNLPPAAPGPIAASTDEPQLESSPDESEAPAARTRRDVGDWIGQSTDKDDEVVRPLEAQSDPDSATSDIDAPPASSAPPECVAELGDEHWLDSEPDESDGLVVRARRDVDAATASPDATEPTMERHDKLQWRVISETASVDSPPGCSVPTTRHIELESPDGHRKNIVLIDTECQPEVRPACAGLREPNSGEDLGRSPSTLIRALCGMDNFVVDAPPSSTRVLGMFEGPSYGDGLGA